MEQEINESKKGLSIASMCLGIVSLALFFTEFLSIICGILALIFSAKGKKEEVKDFQLQD